MIVELVVVGTGAGTLLACGFGELLARRGRTGPGDADRAGGPLLPWFATGPAHPPLPLVAPGRSPYGTATQLIERTAQELRPDPTRSRLTDRPGNRRHHRRRGHAA